MFLINESRRFGNLRSYPQPMSSEIANEVTNYQSDKKRPEQRMASKLRQLNLTLNHFLVAALSSGQKSLLFQKL
jgi:energy-coupling factor transporter ATP-binding protein EcfA2